jgi:hypothetical protein
MRRQCLLCVAILVLALLPGCVLINPPPEAVLAGTWRLETTGTNLLGETTLTFDSRGRLSSIDITPAGGVQIVRASPLSETNVDDDNVDVNVNLLIIGTLSFSGTLNADNTAATGTLTTNLNLGLVSVVLDSGAATLTKVP